MFAMFRTRCCINEAAVCVPVSVAALIAWAVVLGLWWPVLRDAYIAADGGECVYTGNGTASCTPVRTGTAKPVMVYNTPETALVVGATYVGLACQAVARPAPPPYDPETAMPNFRLDAGMAVCVPAPADHWTFVWRGKLDGPPDSVPAVFTPNASAYFGTVIIVFPSLLAIAAIAATIVCIRKCRRLRAVSASP